MNYLRRFISNLAGKIDAFTPILQLKNDAKFAWGAEQQEAFDLIKKYLSSAPVLKAPQVGAPFRLYIAAEDKVIGAVLTQETKGKEHVVTYLSRRLVDACRRSETGGSLSRRVNVAACPSPDGSSVRASAKGGSEAAGDRRERGGNPAAFVFVQRPGRVRLQ